LPSPIGRSTTRVLPISRSYSEIPIQIGPPRKRVEDECEVDKKPEFE
jgi:hypothetical protein